MLCDLIPRETRTYVWFLAIGSAVVVSLAVLYGANLAAADRLGTSDGRIAAFDLDGEGSLAAWFSSTLLFLSFQTSLLIAYARRNSADALPHESRIWSLSSLVWLLMSIDELSSLHEGFKELAARVFHTRIMGDGSIYWAVPYAVLLLSVGFTLLWQLRDDACAAACLLTSGVSFAVAASCQLEWILPGGQPMEVIVEECCELWGDLFLLGSLGFAARHFVHAETRASEPPMPVSLVRRPHLRVVGVGDADPAPQRPTVRPRSEKA